MRNGVQYHHICSPYDLGWGNYFEFYAFFLADSNRLVKNIAQTETVYPLCISWWLLIRPRTASRPDHFEWFRFCDTVNRRRKEWSHKINGLFKILLYMNKSVLSDKCLPLSLLGWILNKRFLESLRGSYWKGCLPGFKGVLSGRNNNLAWKWKWGQSLIKVFRSWSLFSKFLSFWMFSSSWLHACS